MGPSERGTPSIPRIWAATERARAARLAALKEAAETHLVRLLMNPFLNRTLAIPKFIGVYGMDVTAIRLRAMF